MKPHQDNRGFFIRIKLKNPAAYMRLIDGDLMLIKEEEEDQEDGSLFLWRPDWDCKTIYSVDRITELANGYNGRIFAILDQV